jgi:ABC-type nitrate/sulfonate/bicarbonate transport system substrate-binding protein
MTQISRRHYLAAGGAFIAAAFAPRTALAQTTIRQGYQTNLWGMPTYYLLRSGLLEKRPPATSPCSRWSPGRWIWGPMRVPR